MWTCLTLALKHVRKFGEMRPEIGTRNPTSGNETENSSSECKSLPELRLMITSMLARALQRN